MFVNELLPEFLSNGSVLGPSWNTTVQTLDNGQTRYTNQTQSAPVWRYDISKSLLSLEDTDDQIEAINELVRFFVTVRGAATTWKLWDPIDHSTHQDGRSSATGSGDAQLLGVGDGAKTSFQLLKTYRFGSQACQRIIVLPKLGTVRVWKDGVLLDPSAYSVGETSGLVTLPAAPALGEVLHVDCQFYVHAAFTEEADRWLGIEGAGNTGSISSLPVVEVPSSLPSFDVPNAGGARDLSGTSMTGPVSLTAQDGEYQQLLNASGTSQILYMPPKASVAGLGGPIFWIENSPSSDAVISIRDVDTDAVVATVNVDAHAALFTFVNSLGERIWRVFY